MNRYKFIIVSNRLPIRVSREKGRLIFKPSSGGLATAISSVHGKVKHALWIGWPGISADGITPTEKAVITRKLKKYNCQPVYLNDDQIKNFYSGYANDTIWPLFHYFQSLAKHDSVYWSSYQKVNNLFKRAVQVVAQPSATIWVHDYHLMLLPSLLRASLPKASIGYFLHIPFPSYEIFRLLPNRREILGGLLGADLIGFHIYDYARHFLNSVIRILGVEDKDGLLEFNDRLIRVDVFPLGIDHAKFKEILSRPETSEQTRAIKDRHANQKIILSIDRLDYTKGILGRLQAFELLLKEHPKLIKKIVLVMITSPSRTDVQSYRELKEEIDRSVGRINGRYASPDWTPIAYQFTHLSQDEIAAFYAAADIALVTPLRDGMNLVAKEYIAAKVGQPGVLILSETAGAIDELQEAIHVNPSVVPYMKDAMQRAINMPVKEQQRSLRAMQRRLSTYDVHNWADDFLEQLSEVKKAQAEQNAKLLNTKVLQLLKKSFRNSTQRLIVLDYDGTIQQFVNSPDPYLAKPAKPLLKLIKGLTKPKSTQLCIISGRSRQALELWFGDMPVELVAEHGAWIKNENKWSHTRSSFTIHKSKLLKILKYYERRTVGATIEEKDYSLVWHFRNVPPELAYVRNTDLKNELDRVLSKTDIEAIYGNKIIEIKSRRINKGRVVRKLLAAQSFDFILCIGDDYSDEDMFKAMPSKAFTIRVGLGQTEARFRLPSISSVLNLLKSLSTYH